MSRDMREVAKRAAEWPVMQQVADDYSISWRVIRAAIERGEIEAIKVGHIRVNPASVEAWLEARYSPGR
jgi:excisionase family DNA binding protein